MLGANRIDDSGDNKADSAGSILEGLGKITRKQQRERRNKIFQKGWQVKYM